MSDELKNECSFNSYCLVIIKIIVLSENSANECLQALFGYNIFDTLIDLSSKYVLFIPLNFVIFTLWSGRVVMIWAKYISKIMSICKLSELCALSKTCQSIYKQPKTTILQIDWFHSLSITHTLYLNIKKSPTP